MKLIERKFLLLFLVVAVIFSSAVSFAGVATRDETISGLKDAIKASPDDADTHIKLGKLYSDALEYELAQRHFIKAIDLGASKKVVAYPRGYAYKSLGYYDEAIEQFKVARANKDDEAASYFQLGYCYFKKMDYDRANVNLDKAKALDSGLTGKVMLYKGIIKYERKDYDGARIDLQAAVDYATEDTTTISARNYISGVRKKQRGERDYFLLGAINLVFDDNVATASDSEALNVSDKEDIGLVGYLRGGYYPIKSEDELLLVSYMFYQKGYEDLHEYDLQNHNLLANYAKMFSDSLGFGVKYNYDYYSLDGDRYFQRHRLQPSVRFIEAQDDYLEVNCLAEAKEHFSQTELSSKNFGAGLKQMFEFRSGIKLSLIYAYNQEDTRSADFDYEGNNFRLALAYPLPYSMDFDLDTGLYMKDYDKTHSVYGKKRGDDVLTVYCRLKKELTGNISTAIRYDYTSNDSNISYYDYIRNVVYLELKYIY